MKAAYPRSPRLAKSLYSLLASLHLDGRGGELHTQPQSLAIR